MNDCTKERLQELGVNIDLLASFDKEKDRRGPGTAHSVAWWFQQFLDALKAEQIPDAMVREVIGECRAKFEGCKLTRIKLEGGRVWLYFDNGFKIDTNSDRIGYAESDVQVVEGATK